MSRIHIQNIDPSLIGKEILVKGWVRTLRAQKNFAFLEINDGSCFKGIQAILDQSMNDFEQLTTSITTGTAIAVTGKLVKSPGEKQNIEIQATSIEIIGTCPSTDYPLQKKGHSFEFLRTIAHLRARTNTGGAVMRVRNTLAFATHEFFQKRGFLYVHTPIITSADCEGGGQQFLVTTLDPHRLPLTQEKKVDFTKDFFQKPTYLTVSGQLNGETLACALSNVYTFGPTFRAENSNTSRHLAEFWMIEPEMAFANLKDNMECAEAYLKFILSAVLERCPQDMEFFEKFVDKKDLISRLQHVIDTPFARISYTEAIDILQKSGRTFEYPVEWGTDLQSEHERYLAEEHCKKPVILTDYPAQIKAFYMRMNDDGKTVAAMDVLVPKIGEIMGGSQREERLDHLKQKMIDFNLNPEDYWWYLQLREYGSVPHAGFGAGFERLVQFATGMENIRDVIPFPRYPGHAEF